MAETKQTGLLSVVLPAYNEEASVPRAARVICGLLAQAGIPHELIFVDDGSKDGTWAAVQAQAGPSGIQVSQGRVFWKKPTLPSGVSKSPGRLARLLMSRWG